MAKGSNKFTTFGGVFTPSILTILGVIMYLRLPQVVGNSGIWQALGIILAAHVISITTGLSISSIATDKKVGAGGPYYIVSRSLGLPIGGTLGLALFVGLAFSVSLYIIGFSESFLAFWELPGSTNAIRICGSIILVLVTAVTLFSTALAIKAQYAILSLIALSLVSIFFGTPESVPAAPSVAPVAGAPSFAVLFGIFFPAVTGFTAGVNMSGDLKDPKRSIPLGTMAAIAAGMVIYVSLAVFLVYRVEPRLLVEDTQVLVHIALVPWLVVLGIWGATISSAMGSILGAPRILQALSVDRVTPRFFAVGVGKSNEPRRALVLAFTIAWAGILIGELDVIARVVSMFFMATYGFLNLSCAIEAWASTDFRPTFKIPKTVSILGFITVMLLMYQLDPAAMFGAMALFTGLFVWIKRRELTLESGDTWAGVWYSLVRSNLTRLTRNPSLSRDYRPNVIAFSRRGSGVRAAMLELGEMLIRQRGMLTDVELCEPGRERRERHRVDDDERVLPPGIFRRELPCDDPWEAMSSLVRYHGFPGLEPNTVMLPWAEGERVTELVRAAADRDLNTMLLAADPERTREASTERKLDLWWGPNRGNFALALSVAKYLSSSDAWQLAQIRFLLVNDEAVKTEALYRTATRLCAEARLEATVKVLNNTLGDRSYDDWVRRESTDSDLVILGLPLDVSEVDHGYHEATTELIGHLKEALIVGASSQFHDGLRAAVAATMSAAASASMSEETVEVELPEVEISLVPELATEARRVTARIDAVAAEFEEACLAPAYRIHHNLHERALALVTACFDQLAGAVESGGSRQRKTISRVYTTFLQQATSLLGDFASSELESLRETLEQRIEWFLGATAAIREGAPANVLEVFREQGSDEGKAAVVKTQIPLEALLTYHLDWSAPRVLREALERAVRHSSQETIKLAKALNSVRMKLTAITSRARAQGLDSEQVEAEREAVVEALSAQVEASNEARQVARRTLLKSLRQVAVELAWDFERPDPMRFTRRDRRVSREGRELAASLVDVPAVWVGNESLLCRRAQLDLMIASFQGRLAVIIERSRDAISGELRGGVNTFLEELLVTLHQLIERVKDKGRVRYEGSHDHEVSLDVKRFIDDLVRKTQAATSTLPESFESLDDQAILRLEENPFEEVEPVAVSVRRRVEFLVQAELVGRLRQGLVEAVETEQRALEVARDVQRLISFNINDLLEEEEEGEAFRERLMPIITEGIGRLEAELLRVRDHEPRIVELIGRQLDLVVERTDAYAITGSEDGLRQYVGSEGARQQAVNRFQRVVTDLQATARKGLIQVFYRRSEGQVLAHQLQSGLEQHETVVEQVLRLVNAATPRPKVLEALPFYYQQPFLGKTRISSDFWVGRGEETDDARRAIRNARAGARGALLVTGERNSGKSSFCRSIANREFRRDRVFHIVPPPGGSIDPAVFKQTVEVELGAQGDWGMLFGTLPEGSVVVLHDLELWFERSDGGLEVIELIRELVEEHSDHCFFIVNLGLRALRFITRLSPLSDAALAIIECGPLPAEVLKRIVMLRHRSIGLTFHIDGREEEEIAEWRLARLFGQLFDASSGNVGVALQGWVTHIDSVEGRMLQLRTPSRPSTEILHELPMEWVALLLELVIHNQVTTERLQRLTQLSPGELFHQLRTLERMGLVIRSKQGVIEINRFVGHLVTDHLRERGLLS